MCFTVTTAIVSLAVLVAATHQSVGRGINHAIPITKHSFLVNADSSVNLVALNSHLVSVRAKILRGLDNLERNTGIIHPAALWYGTISVGTPAKTFTVDFDTGSSDLFVPASTCNSTCDGHTRWDPASSSTARDLGQDFTLLYGDGSTAFGEQYTDTVSIACFTATTQTLGAVTLYSSEFGISQFSADGLLGMAFQSISSFGDHGASPVFATLVSEGQVANPAFSFKLASSGAELYIGGSNSALYTGDFTYVPVTHRGYWQVKMDHIQGNGRQILSNVAAIIDTGTTAVVGHPSEVSKLHKILGGKSAPSDVGEGYYTFPCNSFPEISLTFGGRSFPMPTSALNLGPVSSGSSECVSGIVGMDTGASFWIVGDVFLQGVYTTFDFGNSRVGFAQLA